MQTTEISNYAIPRKRKRRTRVRTQSSPLLRGYLHVCLVAYYGAMGSILPSLVSPMLILFGLSFVALIVSNKDLMGLAKQCGPLMLLWGLTVLSTVWSPDPVFTLRQSMQLLCAIMLGILISGSLGPFESVKLMIRSLSLTLLICLIWVYAYPDIAIHQATDSFQSEHAGLWRGVLGHKVYLGAFSGFCIGLLLYFGPKAFSNPISYLIALVIAIVCLVGSGSATGIVVALVMTASCYSARWLLSAAPELRFNIVVGMVSGTVALILMMYFGVLNRLASMVGKTADLSGRADYWPHVISMVNDSPIWGHGFVAGHLNLSAALESMSGIRAMEAHNGVLDLLLAFGYVGGGIAIALHLKMYVQSLHVLQQPYRNPDMAVFPYAVITTIYFSSYAESVLLTRVGLWTVILSLAYANIVQISKLATRSSR